MSTVRMIPPNGGDRNPIVVNGRTYTCAANGTIDVPDFDAKIMEANGWHPATSISTVAETTGATAARPVAPPKGHEFCDTTVGAVIRWDGKGWRNKVTGASV